MTSIRVGFIGLGSMGAPMACRIADDPSLELAVWARRESALVSFRERGIHVASSPADLGNGLDVLCTCVFDAAGTREILFGADGAAHGMPCGSLIVCHSTVAPNEAAELAAEAARYDLMLLDAPVSGGAPRAETGELVAMIGGDDAAFARALPVLRAFANPIVRLGGVGAGQQAKLINNTLLAAHVALAEDAFRIAAGLGMDRQGLAEVLRDGSGRSYGAELLAMIGSTGPMATSALGITLSKDVPLLTNMIVDLRLQTVLLPAAGELVRRVTT